MSAARQQGRKSQLSLFAEQEAFLRPDANGDGGTGAVACQESQALTASRPQRALAGGLLEQICEPANLNRAYRKVKANKGAAGVDGMTVGELKAWIAQHQWELVSSLLAGAYQPQPVRGVPIPKPGGGMRQLAFRRW
jgi:RNA-directed DNA polymerase